MPFRCASRTSFERPLFQKPVQIIQQKLSFWQSRSENSLLLKSRILKIVRVFLSLLEDRKRLFGASFDSKLTYLVEARFVPSRNALFSTIWGTILGLKALFWILRPFWYLSGLFPFYLFFDSLYGVGKSVLLAKVKRTFSKNRRRHYIFSSCPSSQNCNCNGGVARRNVHFPIWKVTSFYDLSHFSTLSIFSSFPFVLRRRQNCVPRQGKTYNFEKWAFEMTCSHSSASHRDCEFYIRNTYIS